MNLREQIKKDVQIAISHLALAISDEEVGIFKPDSSDHGDYSTNMAFKIFSKYSSSERTRVEKSKKDSSRETRTRRSHKQSPMEFANKLTDSLKDQPYIEKLEVKEPGFINFFIKSQVLQKEVESLLNKKTYDSDFANKKIIIEFTDPNPFKEFHVGHLYSNSVGEAISRLLEACGAKVKRANYQGDVGLHVAKCIWGIRKKVKSDKGKGKSWQGLKSASLAKKIDFLGLCYAAGAEAYETDEKAKEEIIKLNKEIYEKLDAIEEYKLGKAWSLENFQAIYARLGTKFDLYYFESEVGTSGVQIVDKNIGKVFEKSEGAVIFPGEKYNLHSRVFINSLGLPTYEAKELGLAFKKYEDFAYDFSIIITGSEIIDYFKVLIKAIELIDPNLSAKTRHIAHGMVRMPGGKISSRLGNVISGQYLLDEAKKRAKDLGKDKAGDKNKSEEIAEQVAVGAVKYALLKGNVSQDIKFSFDDALALDGNSGPYLQYTYARCRSVLNKRPFDKAQGEQETRD